MSAAKKGQPSSMLGKKHSEETKLKMAAAKLGKASGMQGKKHSKETRKRMSVSAKNRFN